MEFMPNSACFAVGHFVGVFVGVYLHFSTSL